MAPTFKHGKGSFLSLAITGSTVNLSSGLDDVTFTRNADTAEITTYGDNDRSYLVGLRDATANFSGHWSSTHETFLNARLGSTTALTMKFGPGGNASGARQYQAGVILTSLEVGAPVGDKVSLSGTIQVSGAVTSTAF